jgi:hypothetical protein
VPRQAKNSFRRRQIIRDSFEGLQHRQTFEARKDGKLWKTYSRYIREKKAQRTEVPFHWRLCIGGSPLEPLSVQENGAGQERNGKR